MTVQMVIEVQDRQGAQTILRALDGYKIRVHSGIERTKRRLATFEDALRRGHRAFWRR